MNLYLQAPADRRRRFCDVTGRIKTSHLWAIQNQPLTPLPQLSRPQLFGGT